MTLLEAEVHKSLRDFLRGQKDNYWPHHLTMARLVSRSLRLKCSALIQTGSSLTRYCLSYLTPALISEEPVCLVVPLTIQNWLFVEAIPQLQKSLFTNKPISLDYLDSSTGLGITSTAFWLNDRLFNPNPVFPPTTLTLIDQADQLEDSLRELLSLQISPQDWLNLLETFPSSQERINSLRIKLIYSIFAHPENPYNCHLFDDIEYRYLMELLLYLKSLSPLPTIWEKFQQQAQSSNYTISAIVDRQRGSFTLQTTPLEVSSILSNILSQQPVVLMGGFLDAQKDANLYRSSLGLGNILSVTFYPNRQTEQINLYLPNHMPLPNTPEFQGVLLKEISRLIKLVTTNQKPIVILVEDVPLKAQIAAILAAEFGSRVQVEKKGTHLECIVISSWSFWLTQQEDFPVPELLIMATLPLPSPENPLVAAQISYYKKQKQDWFRLYLLPQALKTIQRAVMPLRESQGMVALLDSRVLRRSYGTQILESLSPYARINYLDKEMLLL